MKMKVDPFSSERRKLLRMNFTPSLRPLKVAHTP